MAELVRSYRDLIAWQKGMELVREIYRMSRDFPKDEIFGLISQIRRAAVSIPSNIAEEHQNYPGRNINMFLVMRGPHWQRLKRKFYLPMTLVTSVK